MWKKIFVGALLVGLITVLIVGAINRTEAKLGNGEGGNGGHGQGRYGQQVTGDAGRRGNGNVGQQGTGVGQAAMSEWITVNGTVTSVSTTGLVVETATGETVNVTGRAWSLAQAQGYAPRPGDSITLVGFSENGTFQVGRITLPATGQTIAVRDENGRPLWAGRGRNG